MKEVIIDYLNILRLKVSDRYLSNLLLSHPDYPSILSVSDVLEQLGLNVQVGKIGKKQLPEIPFPYLLHSNSINGGFLLVDNEQTLAKKQEKLKAWEGVILKAEYITAISDPSNNKALHEDRFKKWTKRFAISGMGLLLLTAFLPAAGLFNSVFLLTILCGLLLGYVLVAKELGVKYNAVESFCGAGAVNHCDKVLTSEYSKIFGAVTFSDLVLTYFAFQTIVAGFIIPYTESPVTWWSALGGLTVLTIPAILYSIYYQWVKIQAWCRLCLLVTGVLMLQIGFFAYAFQGGSFIGTDPGLSTAVISILLFLTIGSAAIWVKGIIKEQNKAEHSEAAAKRVKYDPKVFTQYLLEQRKAEVKPLKYEISIGNPKAELQLVMASNLFCNPCKGMHKKLNALLQVWPDSLHISFRFLPVKTKDENETNPRDHMVHYWLQNIHGLEEESGRTQKIIHDWFNRKNIDEFLNKYELRPNSHADLSEVLQQQDNWVKEAGIIKTPTLFLNGYEFPQQYMVQDLTSMIPGLVDYFQNQNKLTGITHKKDLKEIV